jgi:hypothetical protein
MKTYKKFTKKHLLEICKRLNVPLPDKQTEANLITAIAKILGKPPYPPPP